MDWYEQGMGLGPNAIIFPVRIFRTGNKWQKRPLVESWQKLTQSVPTSNIKWADANGYGILMGHGLYALDIDNYKIGSKPDVWLKKKGATGDTRVHKTVSGGSHAIYRTPAKFGSLPTRTGIVAGLDGRGDGGWIAFGEGYEVARRKALAMLSDAACKDIVAGYSGGSRARSSMPVYSGLTKQQKKNVLDRLEVKIMVGARIAHRWNGATAGTSSERSGRDYSMAHMLARAEFTYQEIIFLLTEHFRHGQAHGAGPLMDGKSIERAICRCADAAIQALQAEYVEPAFKEPEELTEEQEAIMLAAIQGRKGT